MTYCKYYDICEIANNSCEEGLPCGLYSRRERQIEQVRKEREEYLAYIQTGDSGLIKFLRMLK